MQILVDSQPYPAGETAGQTLQQLADEVCAAGAEGEGRLIVGMACDGAPVEPGRLDEFLPQPVSNFETIELQTVSVRDQVVATVDQALEVLGESDQIREQVADELNQGHQEAAMVGLQKLLEIFKQVQQTTFLSSQLLGVSLESIQVDGADMMSILTAVKDRLNDLKAGMENQDFVAVADTLRYEFAEPLEAWTGILQSLRHSAQRE